jgi:hypothetical protein
VGGNPSAAGINESQTIACNDSIVNVSGISNTVAITGHRKSSTCPASRTKSRGRRRAIEPPA